MKCTSCQRESPDGQFCAHCGALQTTPAAPAHAAPPAPDGAMSPPPVVPSVSIAQDDSTKALIAAIVGFLCCPIGFFFSGYWVLQEKNRNNGKLEGRAMAAAIITLGGIALFVLGIIVNIAFGIASV